MFQRKSKHFIRSLIEAKPRVEAIVDKTDYNEKYSVIEANKNSFYSITRNGKTYKMSINRLNRKQTAERVSVSNYPPNGTNERMNGMGPNGMASSTDL